MNDRVKVLVVDDSAVVRRLLTEILSEDPEIEFAGSAPNAALAIAKIRQAPPDVVTLDVEMPDVSGLELLAQIRQLSPRLPVIMFSSLTQRAAATTLEALALGASDYVTKPSGTNNRESAMAHVRSELLPKIKALARVKSHIGAIAPPIVRAVETRPLKANVSTLMRVPPRIDAVVIAASTGGPNALGDLFKNIPANFSVPILVVQHMPPLFTRLLAERLTSTCPLKFSEGVDGATAAPGEVYIAPGGHHMAVKRIGTALRIEINQAPPENSVRPAADVLFRSCVTAHGANVLAVVLTGMGQDGLRGCEAVRAAGGWIVAQDEASSVVWGMPGFVTRAGLADRVLPLSEIAAEINHRVHRSTQSVSPSFQPMTHHGR